MSAQSESNAATQPPSQEASPRQAWSRWQSYEWALGGVGVVVCAVLCFFAGLSHTTTWEALAATAIFALTIHQCRRRWAAPLWQRLRLASAYGFTLWFFGAFARIIPAWGRSPLDPTLLQLDRWLFGETPAALWQGSPKLTAIMSAAYLSYLLYLHIALLHYGLGPLGRARWAWRYVFITYSIGFLGYLLVPAVGPQVAFPALFPTAIPGMDAWISQTNHTIVTGGSGVYDVFPSLHVLITCVILHIDWHHCKGRFWFALPLSLPLFASTLYLRYHYAIDLIAGLLLFGILATYFHRRKESVI